MIQITYAAMLVFISICWIVNRAYFAYRQKSINWKRELQLMLVYICIVVIVRFTFCPFGKVDGQIQPLILELDKVFTPRINLMPFVHLFEYPTKREILLNLIGNFAMFVPVGIVWPIVYKKLDTPKKVILAGVCFSLCIEIVQFPFYGRVSDIDDLILNSLGYIVGYGIYLFVGKLVNYTIGAKSSC